MRITRRALMSASVAAVVLLAGAATASGAGSAGAFGPKRVAAHGRLDRAHAVAGTRTVSRVPAAVRVRTVDTASFKLDDERSLRFMVGDNRAVVLRREQ